VKEEKVSGPFSVVFSSPNWTIQLINPSNQQVLATTTTDRMVKKLGRGFRAVKTGWRADEAGWISGKGGAPRRGTGIS